MGIPVANNLNKEVDEFFEGKKSKSLMKIKEKILEAASGGCEYAYMPIEEYEWLSTNEKDKINKELNELGYIIKHTTRYYPGGQYFIAWGSGEAVIDKIISQSKEEFKKILRLYRNKKTIKYIVAFTLILCIIYIFYTHLYAN